MSSLKKNAITAPMEVTIFSFLALIYASYSSYLVYYDINNYKNPITTNKIEMVRYAVNLLFVIISIYLLVKTSDWNKYRSSFCVYDNKNLTAISAGCLPFTVSVHYLLLLFIMIHLYDAVITISIYHKLIKDVALIKKLKIVSISLNVLVVLLSLNYLRELTFNAPYDDYTSKLFSEEPKTNTASAYYTPPTRPQQSKERPPSQTYVYKPVQNEPTKSLSDL
jgi:hypothetical protein